jgi:hypothetical protein
VIGNDMAAFMKKGEITGRSGPTPNLIAWKPLEGQLPMKHAVTGHRLGGVIALAVGVPWLLYSVQFLIEEHRRMGLDWGLLLLSPLVLGGLAVTLFGLSQFVYREETVIDAETVRWTRHGLTGSKAWQEPLSRYLGVLKDYQYRSGHVPPYGDGSTMYGSHMEYMLTLHHADSSKRVRLYESQNSMTYPPEEWNRLWTHYAKLFRLPVLEGSREGIASSMVDDLARSLLDKIAEGKVMVPVVDLNEPRLPAGLSLHREDDLWVITLKPVGDLRNIAFLFTIACAMLGIGMVFYIFQHSLPPFFIALAFFLVVMAWAVHQMLSMTRKFRHPDQVAVDAKSLWYRSWDRRRGWDTRSIPIAEIVNIALHAEPAYYSPGEQVVVEGKRGRLEFGAALTDKARKRLCDLLLFLVSNAAGTRGVR